MSTPVDSSSKRTGFFSFGSKKQPKEEGKVKDIGENNIKNNANNMEARRDYNKGTGPLGLGIVGHIPAIVTDVLQEIKKQLSEGDGSLVNDLSLLLTRKPSQDNKAGLPAGVVEAVVKSLSASIVTALVGEDKSIRKEGVAAAARQVIGTLQVEALNNNNIIIENSEDSNAEVNEEEKKLALIEALSLALVGDASIGENGLAGNLISRVTSVVSQVLFGKDVTKEEGGIIGAIQGQASKGVGIVVESAISNGGSAASKVLFGQEKDVTQEEGGFVAAIQNKVTESVGVVVEQAISRGGSAASQALFGKDATLEEGGMMSVIQQEVSKAIDPRLAQITTSIAELNATLQKVTVTIDEAKKEALPSVTKTAKQFGDLAETVTRTIGSVANVFGKDVLPEGMEAAAKAPKVRVEVEPAYDFAVVFANVVEELYFNEDSYLSLLNPIAYIVRGLLNLFGYLFLFPAQGVLNFLFSGKSPEEAVV